MIDRAPGGDLSYDLLQTTQPSRSASADEKIVAKTLSSQFGSLATDDPHSLKRFTKYVGFAIGRAVREDGLVTTKMKSSQRTLLLSIQN